MIRRKRIMRGVSLKGPPSASRSSAPPRAEANSDRPKYVLILEKAGQAIRTAEAGYQTVLRNEMAKVYGVAQTLAKSPMRWKTFCLLPYWKQVGQPPDKSKRADALRYVLRFTFGLGDDASKKASFYYRALKILRDEGIAPDEVASTIKARGGFKKLAEESSERPPDDDEEHGEVHKEEVQESTKGRREMKAEAPSQSVEDPPGKAVGKEKAPSKSGNYVANIIAELGPKMGFNALPVGARFVMEATMKEAGKETVIAVHRIERITGE